MFDKHYFCDNRCAFAITYRVLEKTVNIGISSSTDSKSIRESEMQINEHKKCHQYNKLNVFVHAQ